MSCNSSLNKTIIVDSSILVIDAKKDIQAQGIECIVISEILYEKIIIAFIKIDLLKNDNEIKIKVGKL